jgi:hypothetical protein
MSILFRSEMRRALFAEACPLCVLRSKDEVRYLYSLLHEGLSNASFLERLAHARGFCAEHASALQRLEERDWHDGLTNASFERPLLADAIAQIGRLPTTARAVRRAKGAQAAAPCPACEARARMEGIRAGQFAEVLQDPEFIELYTQRKRGLCMPHFRMVWFEDMPGEARARLAEAQRRQLETLLGEVDQYLRKHHWHVKEKPLPDESESWKRAVGVLSGQAMSDALAEIFGCGGHDEQGAQVAVSGER